MNQLPFISQKMCIKDQISKYPLAKKSPNPFTFVVNSQELIFDINKCVCEQNIYVSNIWHLAHIDDFITFAINFWTYLPHVPKH